MSLPIYPEYKKIEVSWLGGMPVHWQVRRAKFLFELMSRPVREGDGIVTAFRDGEVTLRSKRREEGFTNALQEIGYQGVRHGDLVIHAMDAFAGAIGVSDSDGKSTPVYSVCRPRQGVANSKYYAHILRYMALGGFISSLAKGIRERSTDFRWADAGILCLPLPIFDEQCAIVSFIDRETGRINALIAEQEKLLALLAEKRQATISYAVTKGVNPDAPMKDSDISWLGQVPAHWEVMQLRRFVLGFEQGWSPECESRQADSEEWGVLKAGCVNGGVFNPSEHKALPAHLEPRVGLEVRDGDVLMSRASGSAQLIGSVVRLVNPPPRLMLSDKIFRLQLNHRVSAEFFAFAMASMPLRSQIEQAIGGAQGLANNLPQASVKEFWLAVPCLDEQLEVVQYLAVEEERIENLEKGVQRSIELLKERRSALISAAVTGKIDVRGLVEPKEAA
jgi:type I restriction enzyme, S subunit